MYKSIIKPILFFWPAEKTHHISTTAFRILLKIPLVGFLIRSCFRYDPPRLKKKVFGLEFSNPVGLAAGFDKDGRYFNTMSALGFGFIEIGTVTPLPQDGNPRPRLFRLPADKALINRMGFNNEGVDAMAERLKNRKPGGLIIGGNIGKNKITPNEKALSDYDLCFHKLFPYVDYFTLNVSSPNTPGLRALQDKEPLGRLLAHIAALRDAKPNYKPVLLKIAPDLTKEQVDDVLGLIKEHNIDGIIATNTTISREGLKSEPNVIREIGAGGLSGAPLFPSSMEIIRYIAAKDPHLPIIGVGGICSPADAKSMLDAGADLIQVYSGMIYEGPAFVKKIKKHLISSI